MLNTIEEIVDDLVTNLHFIKKKQIKEMSLVELVGLHSSFGKMIRNDYRLWIDSPLTKEWRDNAEGRTIIEGIDHSSNHPDAVSYQIILGVWKKLS